MLEGRNILLVEDEYMIAQDLQRELEDAGARVLGPEPTVDRALARIECGARIDGAILDVNLGGEPAFPVADALTARRVPFLFSSGYQNEVIAQRYPAAIVCEKPLDIEHMLTVLGELSRPADGA